VIFAKFVPIISIWELKIGERETAGLPQKASEVEVASGPLRPVVRGAET